VGAKGFRQGRYLLVGESGQNAHRDRKVGTRVQNLIAKKNARRPFGMTFSNARQYRAAA